MSVPIAPKFIVIEDFLPEDLLSGLERHVLAEPAALELKDFGGSPGDGHYSALRKLWVHNDSLGPHEAAFCNAVSANLGTIFEGVGIAPFEVARLETEVCAQRPGSFFAKHIDTDTRDAVGETSSDRIISIVYYFPREPLGFTGGELVFYDFSATVATAKLSPRRNRLVAFPSFAAHEVTPVAAPDDRLDHARWSVNCWVHRARQGEPA